MLGLAAEGGVLLTCIGLANWRLAGKEEIVPEREGLKRTSRIKDKYSNTLIEPFIYQGDNRDLSSGYTLEKGRPILRVSFPELVPTAEDNHSPMILAQLRGETYQQIADFMRQAVDWTEGENEFFWLDFPKDTPEAIMNHMSSASLTYEELMQGKGIAPSNPNQRAILVNFRDLFYKGDFQPKVADKEMLRNYKPFSDHYDLLADPVLNQKVADANNAHGLENYLRAEAEVISHLRSIVGSYVQSTMGQSHLGIDKGNTPTAATSKRSQQAFLETRTVKNSGADTVMIRRSFEGNLVAQIFSPQGAQVINLFNHFGFNKFSAEPIDIGDWVYTPESGPLSFLRNVASLPQKQVLARESRQVGYFEKPYTVHERRETKVPEKPLDPQIKAKVAFALDWLINHRPIKWTKQYIPEMDETAAKLNEAGFKVGEAGRPLLNTISKTKTLQRHTPTFFANLLTAVGLSALFLGAQPLIERFASRPAAPAEVASVVYKLKEESFSILPPETQPKHHNDWLILSSQGVSTDGYYALGTSHRFENGRWILNDKRVGEISYPLKLKETDPKAIYWSQTQESKVRIPIKNGTKLGALSLTDYQGNPVEFKAYLLEDGAVQVEIDKSKIGTNAWVVVEIALIESDQGQIRATQPSEGVDKFKLTGHGYSKLVELLASGTDVSLSPKQLGSILEWRIIYSVDPSIRKRLEETKTSEAAFEVLLDLEKANCEISGSLESLVASLNGSSVNFAVGYMHGVNPATSDTSEALTSESKHGWAVGPNGEPYEAVGKTISQDKATLDFLEFLRKVSNGEIKDDDSLFISTTPEGGLMIIEVRSVKGVDYWALGEKIALAASLAGISFLAGRRIIQSQRRKTETTSQVQPNEIIPTPPLTENKLLPFVAITSGKDKFTLQARETAYSFFNWLAYGGNRRFIQNPIPEDLKTEEDVMDALRSDIPADILRSFLAGKRTIPANLNERPLKRMARLLVK